MQVLWFPLFLKVEAHSIASEEERREWQTVERWTGYCSWMKMDNSRSIFQASAIETFLERLSVVWVKIAMMDAGLWKDRERATYQSHRREPALSLARCSRTRSSVQNRVGCLASRGSLGPMPSACLHCNKMAEIVKRHRVEVYEASCSIDLVALGMWWGNRCWWEHILEWNPLPGKKQTNKHKKPTHGSNASHSTQPLISWSFQSLFPLHRKPEDNLAHCQEFV